MDSDLIEQLVMDSGKLPEQISPWTTKIRLLGFGIKVLVFYEGKPKLGKGIKANWIMHEFRVKGPPRIKENQHDMKVLTTKFFQY